VASFRWHSAIPTGDGFSASRRRKAEVENGDQRDSSRIAEARDSLEVPGGRKEKEIKKKGFRVWRPTFSISTCYRQVQNRTQVETVAAMWSPIASVNWAGLSLVKTATAWSQGPNSF